MATSEPEHSAHIAMPESRYGETRERIGRGASDRVHEVRRVPTVGPGGQHEDRVAVADTV
jgi:hypothetical protein